MSGIIIGATLIPTDDFFDKTEIDVTGGVIKAYHTIEKDHDLPEGVDLHVGLEFYQTDSGGPDEWICLALHDHRDVEDLVKYLQDVLKEYNSQKTN